MLLVSFLHYQADSKKLLKTIKKHNIKTLLLIGFKDNGPDKYELHEKLDDNVVVVDDLENSKTVLFKVLDSLRMDYEFVEISSSITPLSLIAFLTKKMISYNSLATIDLSNCPKSFTPIVLQSAYYISNSINEITLTTDEFSGMTITYPVVSINLDPDKETNLLKELLSLFLTKQEYYSDLSFNKTLSSTILLQLINDEQLSNGQKEFKYPYIQACLSQLSQEQKGKVMYLQRRHNSSDKRALVYTITDYGILTLLTWYLNQITKKETNSHFYKKIDSYFNQIAFSEIVYQYRSNSNTCTVCGKNQVSELFICSLCGHESCKGCLDDHFLNNNCQQQLPIAQN